ncbi:MFS transporter [Haloarchaeobius sp. HRN-SO-5]|uniref:MFS transporter n=1 Tax=Haloarchaeobius sp. HRN-SO-5 TaxID=3446118 RepID=UPI003EBD7240
MQRPSLLAGPVRSYYLYKLTATAGLTIPIWVLFLRAQDLSYTEIMLLDAIWWVGLTAGEIPTGYVGDRMGWRNSLVVGNALRALAVVGMGLSTTFGALAGIYLLWALGSTLQSGSTDAWLYETLDRDDADDAFAHVRGRGQSLTLVSGAVAAVGGGYLGSVDLRYPFFVTGVLWVVGVVVLATMPRVDVTGDDRLSAAEAIPVLRERLLSVELRGVVLWVAVVVAVASATARLTQPVAVDLGVPEVGLGWLYAGFTLLAAAASDRASWLRETVGFERWVTLAPALLGVALAAVWVVPVVALPAFVLIRVVRTPTETLANQYVNDRVETAGRATTLSGVSMVNSMVAIPFGVALGAVADRSPYLALAGGGVVLASLAAVAAGGVTWDVVPGAETNEAD